MATLVVLGMLGGVAYMAVMGAILFISAGRYDLPMFWAYLGVWTASAVIGPLVIDPTLIKERLRPGPGGKDYATGIALAPLWLGQWVVAGLDVGRFHWTDDVPFGVQIVGLLATAAGLAVMVWAAAVNRFFSSVIRIQVDR